MECNLWKGPYHEDTVFVQVRKQLSILRLYNNLLLSVRTIVWINLIELHSEISLTDDDSLDPYFFNV